MHIPRTSPEAAVASVLEPERAAAVAALSADSLATLRTVVTHASVRRFRRDPLPEALVDALQAALMRGPTSSALHSYTFVLVRDVALKAQLAAFAGNQPWIDAAPLLLVGCADLRRTRLAVHAQGYRYTAHDVRMLISASADVTVGIQNASLVAQSLGYGTVLLGGVLNGSSEIAAALGLPERVVPILGLSVGSPALEAWPEPTGRLPQTLLIHHERWSLSPEEERAQLEAFDALTRERGDFEGRRVPWSGMGIAGDDPIPEGEYGWLEHTARKQGRATWIPQGEKVDADLAAQGLRVVSSGVVDGLE